VARYGAFLWGSGPKYGVQPASEFDVEPFVARAVDYRRVDLSWTPPVGAYTRFRLLRNQGNIPEHEEDGIKLIDSIDLTAISNTRIFLDGVENTGEAAVGLVPGGFVFYAVWLLLDDGWYPASYAYTLLAQDHSIQLGEDNDRTQTTHERFMDILPRVYTTTSGNPLDEVDRDSDLWTFLEGFSYTLDELMTYADLLQPDRDGLNLSPERLELRAKELGLSPEPRPSTRYQRRMVKDAQNLFSTKGTLQGVANAVEGLTGYAPDLTESPNLLLSYQDGTFVNSTGLWEANAGVSIDAVDTVLPPTAEPNSTDKFFTCQATVSAAGAFLSYGESSPVTLGVPVVEGIEYSFSFYAKRTDATDVTLSITWYDFRGAALSTSTGTATSVGTDWGKVTLTAEADAEAAFATLKVVFSAVSTIHIDLVQVADSSVTEYREPRELDIFLRPSKTNLVTNPSFEVDSSGWTIVATSTSVEPDTGPVGVETGADVLEVVSTTGGETSLSTTITDRPLGVWHSCSIYARVVGLDPELELDMTIRASTAFSDDTPTAGDTQVYTASAWVKAELGKTYSLKLEARLKDGTTAVNSVSKSLVGTGNWERVSVTHSFGVTGLTAAVVVTNTDSAAHTLYVDGVLLEASFTQNSYFDGSLASSALAELGVNYAWTGTAHDSTSTATNSSGVIRTNFITNPSFEVDAASWTGTATLSRSTIEKYVGNASLSVVASATSDFAATVVPVPRIGNTYTLTSEWQRMTAVVSTCAACGSGLPGEEGLDPKVTLTVYGDTNGETLQFDAAQIETSYNPGDYFDGTYLGSGALWEDDAHDSVSHRYYNKLSRIERLRVELPQFLPMNTPYRVRTYAGTEFSGLA
jgi:hypothetical protein